MQTTQKLLMLMLLFCMTTAQAQKAPLGFQDMFTMKRLSAGVISPDGKWIAYSATEYDIDENRSNSDIFLVSADGKMKRQLTRDPGSDAAPQWSNDGNAIAFVSTRSGDAQIHTIAVNGGEPQQVTSLPTAVASFMWSPDNRYFAISTEVYPDAPSPAASAEMEARRAENKSSGRVIDGLLYRHWNSWREGKYSHVVVVSAKDGKTVDITPGATDSPPVSLGSSHDFVWAPNSQQVAFVRNLDDEVAISTNNDLFLTGRQGGNIRQLTTQKGNDNGPLFSPDGKFVAYMSMARPGFEADQQDLLVLDLAGEKRVNLTPTLDRSVSDFRWAPDGKSIYYYVAHHGRHRLYNVALRTAKSQLLLDNHYIGGFEVSPDGQFLVIRHQTARMPYELFRFDIRNRRMTQLTNANSQRLANIEMNPVEDFWFTGAKGDSVHLMLIKPPGFDPARKYPLVNLIHGGPQGAWGDDFHFRWNSELFAAPGYVVIMINFHGSRGYGQEFCDAVTNDWGGAPYEDIMIGTRWAVEKFNFIDKSRIGAAGASYGGFMINWIAGHDPDRLFTTLVSHAGLYEQVSFFGATEELWFPRWEFNGMPWEDGSLYQKWNPANYAANFKTPMLVVHGEHDYRVPFTQGLQLYTALQMQQVESRLLFFPDEDHFIRKPQNAQLWWATVHEWLARYLQPSSL